MSCTVFPCFSTLPVPVGSSCGAAKVDSVSFDVAYSLQGIPVVGDASLNIAKEAQKTGTWVQEIWGSFSWFQS